MANVKDHLARIMAAVYGKDVRASIHDSIEAINTQVETTTSSEQARVNAEEKRKTAETQRTQAEQARIHAEDQRAQAETTRERAENARAQAEKQRQDAERARVSAEQARTTAEGQRTQSETARTQAEKERTDAEGARASAEQARSRAEEQRVTAENARIRAEGERQTAEQARARQEETRQSQENQRQNTITTIRAEIDDKIAQMDRAIEHTGTLVVDTSLTKSGQVADAKVTGDKIRSLEQRPTYQIDTTLSKAGQVAEAKAVGDKVKELTTSINGVSVGFGPIEHVTFDKPWRPTREGFLNFQVSDTEQIGPTVMLNMDPPEGTTSTLAPQAGILATFDLRVQPNQNAFVPIIAGMEYSVYKSMNPVTVEGFFYPLIIKH